MTHERLEHLLRTEASPDESAWAARPLPQTVADARASVASPRRAGLLLVVAAAAVAFAVAAGAWAATSAWLTVSPRGVGDGTRATASPSASATPASPPASTAPAIGPCTAEDIAVASDPWSGAAGSRGTTVVLRIVDSTPACDLPDVVTARIADAADATVVEGATDPVAIDRAESGTQLELGIAWSNWCEAEPAAPLSLQIQLVDEATWIPVIAPGGAGPIVPPCMGSGQPTNLSVTSLQPSDRSPIEP